MNSRRLMGFTPLAENHLPESLIRLPRERYALHRSKTAASHRFPFWGQKRTFCDTAAKSPYTFRSGHQQGALGCPFLPTGDIAPPQGDKISLAF
jgi:hypothetical protein